MEGKYGKARIKNDAEPRDHRRSVQGKQLAELIDSQVNNGDRKVTVGEAVVAMVLNAMGLTGRPLYLTPRFYESRPVDRLIREDLSSKDFHDYSLGTALDIIYESGITELFFSVASKVLKAQGIDTRFAHLDSTTFSVYGEYNSEAEDVPDDVIHITRGYSKDHAPELNQVVARKRQLNTDLSPPASMTIVMAGGTYEKIP